MVPDCCTYYILYTSVCWRYHFYTNQLVYTYQDYLPKICSRIFYIYKETWSVSADLGASTQKSDSMLYIGAMPKPNKAGGTLKRLAARMTMNKMLGLPLPVTPPDHNGFHIFCQCVFYISSSHVSMFNCRRSSKTHIYQQPQFGRLKVLFNKQLFLPPFAALYHNWNAQL